MGLRELSKKNSKSFFVSTRNDSVLLGIFVIPAVDICSPLPKVNNFFFMVIVNHDAVFKITEDFCRQNSFADQGPDTPKNSISSTYPSAVHVTAVN